MNSPEYPRYSQVGHVDLGKIIGNHEQCPNCGGHRYHQTVSIEYCPDCGMTFDYWHQGGNDVYKAYDQRRTDEHERNRDNEFDDSD